MWFEWKVAVRFLYTGKLQTLLILAGIIIGVAVQIFLGSLIGGLQQDLINQTVGSSPHVMLMAEDALPRAIRISDSDLSRTVTFTVRDKGLSNWQNIVNSLEGDQELTAISPTITGSGFAIRGQKNQPIVFRGIELNRADDIYKISSRLVEGEATVGGNNILLGRELAEELNLAAGDTVQLRT
ncbi:MAG: ABC transporter permease, partial [Halarsenatibacteraceae bacterium]